MATEDDLRRCGQAASAVIGLAATRVRQVAEQLLVAQEKGREQAMKRAEPLVEEGRRAAAEVVGALRREAAGLLRELEHLEESIRPKAGAPPVPVGAAARDSEAARARARVAGKRAAPSAPATSRPAVHPRTAAKVPPVSTAGAKAAPAKRAAASPKTPGAGSPPRSRRATPPLTGPRERG